MKASENQARKYWIEQEAELPSMFRKIDVQKLHASEQREMIGYFPDLKGKRILDLGSGIGRYTRYFSQHAQHLTSVDLVPQFVQKNREDHADCQNIDWICSDVMQIQLHEKSYDFIFFNWLFMYLEDEEVKQLLERSHLWLTRDGELFIRETCELKRSKSRDPTYFVHYRTMAEYASFLYKNWHVRKVGEMKTYIYCYNDPLQCYWHCRKK